MKLILLLACVGLTACGGSLTAPCPSLRSVIGHEYNVHTCQVLS